MAQTFEPIARTVLTGGINQITFSGLSGLTWTDYEIHLNAYTSDNRTHINMTFNGSTSAQYNYEYIENVGGTTYVGNGINQSNFRVGFSAQGNVNPSFHLININSQAGSGYRSYTCLYGATWPGNNTGQYSVGNYGGTWYQTASITSITLLANFNAGTVATLYGLRAS